MQSNTPGPFPIYITAVAVFQCKNESFGDRRVGSFGVARFKFKYGSKDWRKAVSVPQLTAAQDDLESSTHAPPLPTGASLPGASSVAMIKERAVLQNPSAAQSRELKKLQRTSVKESAVTPKVSDSTDPFRALSDQTPTARVVKPSLKALLQHGFGY